MKAVTKKKNQSMVFYVIMIVVAIYGIVTYLRLRRRLITASPLRDNIYLADDIDSPFVMGLIRPKIYLPSAMEEREQSYILLHEQHHIRRLDHVVKALAFVALCIHWFNPLVWVAFILSGKDMEMSCDEAVVKKLGTQIRADYTASLLSLATGKRIIAGMPLAFGEGNTKGRIKNLANWKKPAFWVVLVAVIVCIMLAIGLLTNPKQDSFKLRIVVPAGSQEEFVYSDEEISTIGNSIKIWSGDELGDTEVLLSPVDKTTETGYTATYLTHGMPAVFDAEKDTWFRVGVNMQNPTNEDVIVYVEVENVEVRISNKDTTITEIIPGTTYVSWQCLYMNPLSSYAAMGGDSGCKYVVGDDYFATYRRNDGSIISVTTQPNLDTANSGLQSRVDIPNWKWQAFPYTDEEWAALYKPSISEDFRISEIYDEILYQPLLDGEFLLWVDGDLWLVELKNNPQMGTYLWSIYSLVPESAMGVA